MLGECWSDCLQCGHRLWSGARGVDGSATLLLFIPLSIFIPIYISCLSLFHSGSFSSDRHCSIDLGDYWNNWGFCTESCGTYYSGLNNPKISDMGAVPSLPLGALYALTGPLFVTKQLFNSAQAMRVEVPCGVASRNPWGQNWNPKFGAFIGPSDQNRWTIAEQYL